MLVALEYGMILEEGSQLQFHKEGKQGEQEMECTMESRESNDNLEPDRSGHSAFEPFK
jgi:hypothetical protein